MNYLSRVFKTIREVTWEKLFTSIIHAFSSIMVIIIASLIYWGIDKVMMNLIVHR